MPPVIEAPREWIEAVADLCLPPGVIHRLQVLMDENNDGNLDSIEREELTTLIHFSQSVGLVRAHALHLLGRSIV